MSPEIIFGFVCVLLVLVLLNFVHYQCTERFMPLYYYEFLFVFVLIMCVQQEIDTKTSEIQDNKAHYELVERKRNAHSFEAVWISLTNAPEHERIKMTYCPRRDGAALPICAKHNDGVRSWPRTCKMIQGSIFLALLSRRHLSDLVSVILSMGTICVFIW